MPSLPRLPHHLERPGLLRMESRKRLDIDHIFRATIIGVQVVKLAEQGGERDIHLAHGQVLPDTASATAREGHEAMLLLGKLLRRPNPSCRVEHVGIGEDVFSAVQNPGRHGYRGVFRNIIPLECHAAFGRCSCQPCYHAVRQPVMWCVLVRGERVRRWMAG